MNEYIKSTQSLKELMDFLRCNEYKLNEKGGDFINQLICNWNEGVLSKQLINFHEEELAQQIDAINPNQSECEVCQEIYRIIGDRCDQKQQSHEDGSDFHYKEFDPIETYITIESYFN